MAVSVDLFRRVRSAQWLIALAAVFPLQAAHGASCQPGQKRVAIAGDVPGAISYDIFVAAHPLVPGRLARFVAAQQVVMLHSGTVVCQVNDDGVTDPTAVLVRIPHGSMSYWVKRGNLAPVAAGAGAL